MRNEKVMKVNINHPSFLSYVDEITNNVLSIVSLNNYFVLNNDAKLGIQFIVFKYIDSSLKVRLTVENEDIKNFMIVLRKKTEENENYELSAVIKDIITNFDLIISKQKPKTSKSVRKLKKDEPTNL
jgi:hypothetical protein